MNDIKVGDMIGFGQYPSGTILEWHVLEKSGTELLLFSANLVANRPYHDKCTEITWAECSLRHWLNNDFLNNAFDIQTQNYIKKTKLINEGNPYYNSLIEEGETSPNFVFTVGGKSTIDQIFVLSYSAYEQYAETLDKKTSYMTLSTGYMSAYWLRNPGDNNESACIADKDGLVAFGNSVEKSRGVRPAMWIDLSIAN